MRTSSSPSSISQSILYSQLIKCLCVMWKRYQSRVRRCLEDHRLFGLDLSQSLAHTGWVRNPPSVPLLPLHAPLIPAVHDDIHIIWEAVERFGGSKNRSRPAALSVPLQPTHAAVSLIMTALLLFALPGLVMGETGDTAEGPTRVRTSRRAHSML